MSLQPKAPHVHRHRWPPELGLLTNCLQLPQALTLCMHLPLLIAHLSISTESLGLISVAAASMTPVLTPPADLVTSSFLLLIACGHCSHMLLLTLSSPFGFLSSQPDSEPLRDYLEFPF